MGLMNSRAPSTAWQLPGPQLMVFANGQSEGRIKAENLGVVAIFRASGNLPDSLTHRLNQGMVSMSRRLYIFQAVLPGVDDPETPGNLSRQEKTNA
jgi:hypothetical protein